MKITFTIIGVAEEDTGNIRRMLATLGMLINGSIGADGYSVDMEPDSKSKAS